VWIPDAVLAHVQEVAGEPDLSGTRYRLVRLLGSGGMGAVYAAEDTQLGREVALKVSLTAGAAGSAGVRERMEREARILGQLEHPGIVPVHDIGVLPDGRVFYVMKLVRGEQLDGWAARRPEQGALLRLFQRICEAVAFAHARGVVHRDLKPENVMVGPFGEALVMDWGIAKGPSGEVAGGPMPDASPAGGTASGTVLGTPGYMAPEQARGEILAIDARSDVYALGAVLCFLLTGAPEPLGKRVSRVPEPLVSICAKAMSEATASRYASAQELAEDVGRFLDGEPVGAHRETAIERLTRLASRHRVVLSLLGAYLLLRLLLIALAR
jgi:serine/threonine protein kinase